MGPTGKLRASVRYSPHVTRAGLARILPLQGVPRNFFPAPTPGVMRITDNYASSRAVTQLSSLREAIAQMQDQVTTGKRFG